MGSQYQPWANPDPQSVFGLNSAMVYGENIACTAGVNHSVTVGSNLQLVVNPGTLVAMLGGPKCAAFSDIFGAGGMTGNMQLTIGTQSVVNWGNAYTVNLGGEAITYADADLAESSKKLCAVIGALTVAYAIAYGACSDEDGRATIVIVFQVAVDALLGWLVAAQKLKKSGKQSYTKLMKSLFVAASTEHTTKWENAGYMITALITGVLATIVTPVVAVALEEGHFAAEQSQTQSSTTASTTPSTTPAASSSTPA
ncbi:MAG: hypothetical protein ABSF22_03195 [Bryobacteraceae bacterium]